MHIALTDDQEFFRETVRRFLDAEMPVTTVRALHQDAQGFDPAWWSRAAELGWVSMLVSEGAGGGSLSGRPVADAAIVAEEIGRALAPAPFLPCNLVAAALDGGGDQHAALLAEVVAGQTVVSWAFAEPRDVWELARFTTSLSGSDGSVVVDGTKAYVEAGAVATHLLVVARDGDGLTQVIVPADAKGVTVTPCDGIDLGRRFAEVQLEQVRLDEDAVVGTRGEAAADVERLVCTALVLQAADSLGALDRGFEFTLEYMNDRYAFGRPISSYQALKHRVADLVVELESAKGVTDAAAVALDDGDPEASRLARVANAYVAERAPRIVQEYVQLHGGIGVTWEHDLHLFLRRVTTNRALYGTPELLRDQLCRLLGVADGEVAA